MKSNIIGYGSFFHKTDLKKLPAISNSFLNGYQLFYAGRYALKYVFDALLENYDSAHIWLPQYYCPFVKEWLETAYSNLKYYDIDPFDPHAQINYSTFSTKDIVLVNNYWGLKKNTIPTGARPLIVEDHSHGWLSPGCMESEADLCIASLRKTLPVPLGGIAWKPLKSSLQLSLPQLKSLPNAHEMEVAWKLVDTAMALKANCTTEKDKTQFLEDYGKGEQLLRTTQEIFPLNPDHEEVVTQALCKDYNAYKLKNWHTLQTLLKGNDVYKILPKAEGIPFGLLLAFKKEDDLKRLKQHLISKTIYPAELWPQNNIHHEYKFLLNIHIDYRYHAADMEFIASSINDWNT